MKCFSESTSREVSDSAKVVTPGAQETTNDVGVSKQNKKKDKKNKKTPEDEDYDPVPKTGPNGEPIITRKYYSPSKFLKTFETNLMDKFWVNPIIRWI